MAAGGRHSVSPLATTINAGAIERQNQSPKFSEGASFLQGPETKTSSYLSSGEKKKHPVPQPYSNADVSVNVLHFAAFE